MGVEHKKAEWRELLNAINDCQDSLPLVCQLEKNSSPVPIALPLDEYKKVRKTQQLLYGLLFVDRATIAPVMSMWLKVSEKAMSAIGGNTFEYTIAYGALVDEVRKAARQDLGVGGMDDPESKPNSPSPPVPAPHESAS